MVLKELFYYDKESGDFSDNDRYEPEYDDSAVNLDDTRKTRLTLQQINRVRKASELHDKEKKNEVEFVRQMYGMKQIAAMTGEGGGGL